jgi:hypothetical protein
VHHRLIRLSPSHFAVLLSGLTSVMVILFVVAGPSLWDMCAREIGLQTMGRRHGFKYGAILTPRDERGSGPTIYGIVDLDHDAALARLGLRVHDAPWAYHGHGAEWALYDALRALERGEATSFEVINVDDWTASGRLVTRKVEIPARR